MEEKVTEQETAVSEEKAEQAAPTPKRKPATRKPTAKTKKADDNATSQEVNVGGVVSAVVADVEELVKEGETKAEAVAADVKAEVEKWAQELEGKSVDELRQLRVDALYAESELKRELHVLRLRAANMASIAEHDVDEEIISVKAKLAEAISWLLAVEKKLEGEFKDLTMIRY